jgi:hypothetical protein
MAGGPGGRECPRRELLVSDTESASKTVSQPQLGVIPCAVEARDTLDCDT